MAEGLTRQEKLNQLFNARRIVAELTKELGIDPEELNGDHKLEDRDPLALEFDRLTPLQRYTLYVENRERWRELIAAKQGEGIRTLLRKKA
jgi:hypothetical protein